MGIYSILTIPAGFSQSPAAQPKRSPRREFLGLIATPEKLQYCFSLSFCMRLKKGPDSNFRQFFNHPLMRFYCCWSVFFPKIGTYLVGFDRSPSRCGGSSSLSSYPVCTGSCTGGSVWARPWRSGTRLWPPDRPPSWSCSLCRRPRTASWCGTWCCTPALSDTAHWLSRNPSGWSWRAGSPRPKTARLEIRTLMKRGLWVCFSFTFTTCFAVLLLEGTTQQRGQNAAF